MQMAKAHGISSSNSDYQGLLASYPTNVAKKKKKSYGVTHFGG